MEEKVLKPHEKVAMELAKTIKEKRELAKITQEQLAEKAGLQRNAIIKIESGQEMNPMLETICNILHALDYELRIKKIGDFADLPDTTVRKPIKDRDQEAKESKKTAALPGKYSQLIAKEQANAKD